jgi:hypothetical protein
MVGSSLKYLGNSQYLHAMGTVYMRPHELLKGMNYDKMTDDRRNNTII